MILQPIWLFIQQSKTCLLKPEDDADGLLEDMFHASPPCRFFLLRADSIEKHKNE